MPIAAGREERVVVLDAERATTVGADDDETRKGHPRGRARITLVQRAAAVLAAGPRTLHSLHSFVELNLRTSFSSSTHLLTPLGLEGGPSHQCAYLLDLEDARESTVVNLQRTFPSARQERDIPCETLSVVRAGGGGVRGGDCGCAHRGATAD